MLISEEFLMYDLCRYSCFEPQVVKPFSEQERNSPWERGKKCGAGVMWI